jgi:hypothetical protein
MLDTIIPSFSGWIHPGFARLVERCTISSGPSRPFRPHIGRSAFAPLGTHRVERIGIAHKTLEEGGIRPGCGRLQRTLHGLITLRHPRLKKIDGALPFDISPTNPGGRSSLSPLRPTKRMTTQAVFCALPMRHLLRHSNSRCSWSSILVSKSTPQQNYFWLPPVNAPPRQRASLPK